MSTDPTTEVKHTHESISAQTYLLRERQWFDSFAQNLQAVRSGKDVSALRRGCQGPCIVLGAGPSVEKFKHLTAVGESLLHVVCTDRMLPAITGFPLYPDIVVTVDGSPAISQFYRDERAVRAVLPVNVYPAVSWKARRRGEVYWYVPLFDDPEGPTSVTRAMSHMSNGKTIGHGYGNAGAFAWSLAEFMGHDPIILVGIDFSYGTDATPQGTPYWKGFLEQRGGDVEETIAKDFRWDVNPFGYRVLTDKVWDGYLEVFLKGIKAKGNVTTISTSEYTTIHGDGVVMMSLEDALKEVRA